MRILKDLLYWVLALALTLGAAAYQRATGPTYPLDGEVTLGGEEIHYELMRSHGGAEDHKVIIPTENRQIRGTLYWKRLTVDEPFRAEPMLFKRGLLYGGGHGKASEKVEGLMAELPHQPPAGKLEYHVALELDGQRVELPSEHETAVIRFKGDVPRNVLFPHIFFMFTAMLLAVRTAIGAVAGGRIKLLALLTVVFLGIGGLILGPIVQKFAFGAYWTGWPFGEDLTDNKTLVAFIAWLLAAWRIAVTGSKRGRWWAIGAAVVLLAVYSIPHSARGSSFDYEAGEVTTGRAEEVMGTQEE